MFNYEYAFSFVGFSVGRGFGSFSFFQVPEAPEADQGRRRRGRRGRRRGGGVDVEWLVNVSDESDSDGMPDHMPSMPWF